MSRHRLALIAGVYFDTHGSNRGFTFTPAG